MFIVYYCFVTLRNGVLCYVVMLTHSRPTALYVLYCNLHFFDIVKVYWR